MPEHDRLELPGDGRQRIFEVRLHGGAVVRAGADRLLGEVAERARQRDDRGMGEQLLADPAPGAGVELLDLGQLLGHFAKLLDAPAPAVDVADRRQRKPLGIGQRGGDEEILAAGLDARASHRDRLRLRLARMRPAPFAPGILAWKRPRDALAFAAFDEPLELRRAAALQAVRAVDIPADMVP